MCRAQVWDDLLGRLRHDLDSPSQDMPFRGSLIDEKMFAIDVKEWGMENLLQEQRHHRASRRPDESSGGSCIWKKTSYEDCSGRRFALQPAGARPGS